jgi:hypothetical protein
MKSSFQSTLIDLTLKLYCFFCLISPLQAQNLSKKMHTEVIDTHTFCGEQRPKIHQLQKIAVYLEQMMSKGKSLPTELIEHIKIKALQQVEGEGGELQSSGAQVDYLQSVTRNLMRHMEKPLDLEVYYLTNTKIENAFAIPPNAIVVTEPFVQTLNNEAQLAVVLAHEIAHLYFKHSLALIAIVNDMIQIESSQIRLLIALISKKLLHLLYGNQLEEQADAWGLELAYLSNYDVSTMEEFWVSIQQRELHEMKKVENQSKQNEEKASQSNSLWGVLKNNATNKIKKASKELMDTTIQKGKALLYQYVSKEDVDAWEDLIEKQGKKSIEFIKNQTEKMQPELEALLSSHPPHLLRACVSKKVNETLIDQLGRNQQDTKESQINRLKK